MDDSIKAFESADGLFPKGLGLPGTTVEMIKLDRTLPLTIGIGDDIRIINGDTVSQMLRLVLPLPLIFLFQNP
jgi:hypothetical protein